MLRLDVEGWALAVYSREYYQSSHKIKKVLIKKKNVQVCVSLHPSSTHLTICVDGNDHALSLNDEP